MALPDDYAARAAAPATPRSYALLFALPAARAALTALHALDAEIAAATDATEHSVAHTKLAWWRGEVDRLVAGRPQHPIARALLAAAQGAPDYALLHERLAAADLRLLGFEPADAREADALAWRSHGAVQLLAAQLCAAAAAVDAAGLAEFGAQLGRGIARVEQLAAGDPASDRNRAAPAPDRVTLVAHAREALAAARSALPPAARRAQTHGLVACALHEAWLARIADARAAPTPPPHPLRLLWIAWRTARRA